MTDDDVSIMPIMSICMNHELLLLMSELINVPLRTRY